MRIWRYFFFGSLPLYLLDQASKGLVLLFLPLHDERVIVPGFFSLVHWRNYGAAFSLLGQYGNGGNLLFIGVASLALLLLLVLAWRGVFKNALTCLSMALLLAGIAGNLTDRLLHGSVIDFLLFNLHIRFANPWPAFNVADSCIFLAALLLIFQSFWERKKSAA